MSNKSLKDKEKGEKKEPITLEEVIEEIEMAKEIGNKAGRNILLTEIQEKLKNLTPDEKWEKLKEWVEGLGEDYPEDWVSGKMIKEKMAKLEG